MSVAEATTHIAPPKPAAGHRGRIEVVELGTRFLLVSGWVTGPEGRAPSAAISLALPDGSSHTVGGFLRRRDLAERGIATEPCGFLVDIPRPEIPFEALTLALRAGVRELLTQPLSALAPRPFRPRGHLDHVAPDRIAGWAFDPAQWYGPAEEAALELVVDETARIPLSLNAARRDLPFSSLQRGGQLGFDFGLQDIARLMAALGLERDLLEGDHAYTLMSGDSGSARCRAAAAPAAAGWCTAAPVPPPRPCPPPRPSSPPPSPAATSTGTATARRRAAGSSAAGCAARRCRASRPAAPWRGSRTAPSRSRRRSAPIRARMSAASASATSPSCRARSTIPDCSRGWR
ncbi:hypothetical protein [Dankookia sp. P2]|uniref:hypothetical protein n=1 Tax=Dankookia sp. P2 TaxID=3423955 RepID=UPI003D66DE98